MQEAQKTVTLQTSASVASATTVKALIPQAKIWDLTEETPPKTFSVDTLDYNCFTVWIHSFQDVISVNFHIA